MPTTLTFENLLQFHAQYYHPSQARIFLYGPEEGMSEQMTFISEKLREFEGLGEYFSRSN